MPPENQDPNQPANNNQDPNLNPNHHPNQPKPGNGEGTQGDKSDTQGDKDGTQDPFKDPTYTKGWQEAHNQLRPGITRDVMKQLGAASIDEAKALIEAGRANQQPQQPTDGDQPDKKKLVPSKELQAIIDENQKLKETMSKQASINKKNTLKQALRGEYLKAGGRPNSESYSSAEDDALNLMIQEGLADVDDELNVRTNDGVPLNIVVNTWLQSKPIFKKPEGAARGPKPPGRDTQPAGKPSDLLAAFRKRTR